MYWTIVNAIKYSYHKHNRPIILELFNHNSTMELTVAKKNKYVTDIFMNSKYSFEINNACPQYCKSAAF